VKAADWLLGLVLGAAGISVIWSARGMPDAVGQLYGGGFFPTLVGAGFVVIGVLMTARGVLTGGPTVEFGGWVRNRAVLLRLFALLALVVANILFLDTLGFLASALLLVFMMLLALGVGLLRAAAVSLITVCAVWYVFGTVLRIALPYGILESWLF